MEKQQSNSLQNFDDSKTEILKKRLLKSANTSLSSSSTPSSSQHNVLLNNLRAPTSSSMLVTSVSAPQSSMSISHSLVTHSIAPMKIHGNSSPYPLQLSTVHVPVQIPGSNSNINVPVQLSVPTTSVPLQIAPVTLPLQTPGTTNVPVQLPAGETINVPLQLPTASQNIQLTGPTLPSMPILQNTNQPLSSIIHVHMGNTRPAIDGSSEMNAQNSSQIQINTATSISQVPVGQSPAVVQIPNSSSNSIQLTLPTSVNSGTVQLRGAARPMPHVVYIQTPTGLKPVTSSDMISQASSSGNPPQIIVRRPVTNNSNIHLISNVNKPNIAPKLTASKSILAPANTAQPIVIQKPKSNEKMMVPVTIASGAQAKQTIAYLSSVKKTTTKTMPENQSILISNNQPNGNANNQKLFLTPMMPKIQNTKFILPVTLPATMASKGPIINLQIANGQIQNDPQGNTITVMRDSGMETSEMPPLQPLAKIGNGKDNNNTAPHKSEGKSFTVSIPGSRAEPTGEQGEYTLSIPETNASMNDDIYTVSIADGEGGQTREKSFTLAIPEKGKSLLNKNIFDKSEPPAAIAAPAILRRSFSDNSERKAAQANLKRRISLCAENFSNKSFRIAVPQPLPDKSSDPTEKESNDDHRVPSLFCDEKLEEAKANTGDSDADEFKDKSDLSQNSEHKEYYKKIDLFLKKDRHKLEESPSSPLDEDPPGLIWSNGIATLKGSLLQFRTNEFGLIDIVDSNFEDFMPSAKYNTPLKQRIEMGSNRDKKPSSPEDMYQCDGCGCHGMAAEFITPNFCSLTCQADYQKTMQKRREKEKLELMKKRNKVRKLLMRKQMSDTDALEDRPKDEKAPLKHYDSAPHAPADSQADSAKLIDDFENEKYPWMCGKNGFSWMRYLDFCKAKAAPVKLFKDPFPYNRNNFKVGMRMEAIDPQHPAVFCVVSVAEVQGYRLRLHFDEYPDVYDYWVNADCPDLFPAGWCERNGRSLRPPASYTPTNFSWPLYLKQMRAVAAPKQLFQHCSMQSIRPNGFRIGMKLEAVDRKNNLVCVATITDMLDNRMLINFDSWDEMYDYWVEPTSPHIHPVGWAEEQGVELTPPNYYKDPESFSWEAYLEETGASAAPPRAFKTRPPQGFKPGMKLEVVDPRVPFLIRVATISAVRGHQVKVSFDGWGDALAAWLEDDSPDLHPVGWCLKTQHPLEPPLTEEERLVAGPCGVGGCRGLGSLRGGPHKQHPAASACPYRAPPPSPPDRLAPPSAHPHAQPERALVLPKRRVAAAAAKPKPPTATTPTSDSSKGKYVNPRGRPPKHKRVEEVVKNEMSDDESVSSGGSKKWRGSGSQHSRDRRSRDRDAGRRSPRDTDAGAGRSPAHKEESSLPPCAYGQASAPPPAPLPAPRLQLDSYLQELALPPDPTVWNQEDVATLVSRIAGAAAGAAALAARLSGAELVLASREELVSCARMRLGPAVKVYAAVCQLRQSLA